MAKKEVVNTEEAQILEYMRFLPEEHESLFGAALELLDMFHDAVMASDKIMFDSARLSFIAVIWKMNGGASFGSLAGDNSPGRRVLAHCRAQPGILPKWGQCGDFAIEVDGTRAFVKLENWMAGLSTVHLVFTVVDLDKPFISGTGYRSHFASFKYGFGRSVEAFVKAEFRNLLCEGKRPVMVEQAYVEKLSKEALPDWCYALSPAPQRVLNELPPGYVVVECILPEYRAAVAQQWADAAAIKISGNVKKKSEIIPPMINGGAAVGTVGAAGVPAASRYIPGVRCKIIKTHNAFAFMEDKLGQTVIIAKVLQSGTTVLAYDDRPKRYRVNRMGNTVCDFDPSCIQQFYDIQDLQIIEDEK
jgi:hypothetical protein